MAHRNSSQPPVPPGVRDPGKPPDRTQDVARAMALLWTYRPRSAVHDLLRLMGAKQANGRVYTQEDVRLAIRKMQDRGMLVAMPHREGYHRLTDELRAGRRSRRGSASGCGRPSSVWSPSSRSRPGITGRSTISRPPWL